MYKSCTALRRGYIFLVCHCKEKSVLWQYLEIKVDFNLKSRVINRKLFIIKDAIHIIPTTQCWHSLELFGQLFGFFMHSENNNQSSHSVDYNFEEDLILQPNHSEKRSMKVNFNFKDLVMHVHIRSDLTELRSSWDVFFCRSKKYPFSHLLFTTCRSKIT